MHDLILDQALVRINGYLKTIPAGFERAVKGKPSILVYEIPLIPCSLPRGLKAVNNQLVKLQSSLRVCRTNRCQVVLHLQVSNTNDSEFSLVSLPNNLLSTLVEGGFNLEISYDRTVPDSRTIDDY